MKSLQLYSENSVYLDGVFLFKIKESQHPYHAELHFSNEFPAPIIRDVNTGFKQYLGMVYHLKMGEVVNIGDQISLMMTRFAKVKFRVSIKAPDKYEITVK